MSAATAPATTSTRSPFSLLREADEAEEVLILTYAASLEFFERFALGEARGLQAASTVIADASMVTADPVTVRGAGLRYVDARAVCPGRAPFHPKLLVIARRDRATVAIGSGNLTLAGWHGNEELWTVLHADAETGPTTLRGLSEFLRRLAAGPIDISADARPAVEKVAGLLDGLPAQEDGPRLVSTLHGPILDQLPEGPVDELILYAPFHDSRLRALSAVYDRFSPSAATIFVQSETSIDGERLAGWARDRDVRVEWCADERYRHGKLIEWSRDGLREALTGSPNLSAPALLRGITEEPPDGPGQAMANCELGVVGPQSRSLAPTAVAPPAGGLGQLSFRSEGTSRSVHSVLLLGATLVDGMEVVMQAAAPLPEGLRAQTFDAEHDWVTLAGVGDVPGGVTEHRIPAVALPPNTPLRLFGPSGASNAVFVSDPTRSRRRPLKRQGPDTGSEIEMLEAGRFNVLYEIAELMRPALLRQGVFVTRPRVVNEDSEGPAAADGAAERVMPAKAQLLSDYIAACSVLLEERNVEWALSLPSLPGLTTAGGLEDTTGVLTSEVGDEAADAKEENAGDGTAAPPFSAAVRNASDAQRRRLRHFCEGALRHADAWPNLMRAYVARLVLNGIAAQLWKPEREGEVLSDLIDVLCAPGDDPTAEERDAIGTDAGVALTLLRQRVRRLSVGDEETLRFRRAADRSRPLLGDIHRERLEVRAAELSDVLRDPTGESVFALAAEIASPPGGVEAAVAMLAEEDEIDAHDDDGVLVIDDELPPMAERQLLHCAGMVSGVEPVVVRGRTSSGQDVVCIWRAPDLIIARRAPRGVLGKHYRMSTTNPKTLAISWQGLDVQSNLPKPVADWMPGKLAPDEIAELLDGKI